jgi:YhcH/YjgK/YiaL family protein
MHLGNLRQQAIPGWYPPILKTLLAFMAETDFLAVEPGQLVLLPGFPETDVYCSVQHYQTRPVRELAPEAHRRFADVHLIAQGREAIGWAPLRPGLPVRTPYDPKTDLEFFGAVPGERLIGLEPGDYLVADLDDVHRPRCRFESVSSVVKVVGKIRSQLLKG